MKKSKLFLLTIFFISTIIIVFIHKQFEEKPKVVIVLQTLDRQYWRIIEAGAEKGFKDFGIDGKVIAPKDGTAEEQSDLLENVLKENPDVLVVSPRYSPVIIPKLESFVGNNIPVLLIDTDDSWGNKTAYIGTNNLELGKMAGALLGSQLQPRDKVALIGGEPSPEGERLKGARVSLEAVGIKIVSEKILKSDKVVVKEMQTILHEHPDLKGVIAATDYIALPVSKIIQKQGIKIPIVGADGITEMVELVEEGTLTGTVAQNPYDMGYLSAEAALKVTMGEKVNNIDSGVDIIMDNNARQRLDFLTRVLR
ncbi:sugar ABC transporter substrate-binding protein [Metabacillus rhizolycopersici]|uniref:Sugar ABC transporter substrate-binding protein n=1 Tax=Metabacillus rhizolycopersici TaxID=2875709 RepID=A0ABS7UZZ0_9BACI|nr:sugar ABC transporter substrate-binding protein [Metabacillus rhizolycopersici]MBZ5753489.1 sugar ABC transporter substrate-binding protein [Metabacillus rhizolycopersici]